jgi:uncharacterized protein YdbL (DUF1318 family)
VLKAGEIKCRLIKTHNRFYSGGFNMTVLKRVSIFSLLLFVVACVTINVYFPAAAAESAADTIIKEVYGKDTNGNTSGSGGSMDQTSVEQISLRALVMVMDIMIPPAYAQQPDINISTPGLNRLRDMMKNRHASLEPWYNNGTVGMDNQGLITIRDENAIPLRERNNVKKLVSDENRDRMALYQELAQANGHPEWENEIRDTFARRWIANAPSGWWYIGAGGRWMQK